MTRFVLCVLVCFTVSAASAFAAADGGLQEGTPQLKSAGPLAFGPDGVLFVGDPQAAAIFAIETGDTRGDASKVQLNVELLGEKVAALLGTSAKHVLINDLAVNPASGNAYLSVSRGRGPKAVPVLLRVEASGKISEFSLKNVKFARAALPNPPADKTLGKGRRRRNSRRESITDLAFFEGRVIVAGLSNEEFASKLRVIPFPFRETDAGASVEIFHGAHGKYETRSPVRTFVPFNIDNEPHLLAAYTCTPLVKFPVSKLQPGTKLTGTTVAELGNRNRPLDMIVYKKDGKNYLLLANNKRGVMKIETSNIERAEGITERIGGGGTAGQAYETISNLEGVVQLDRLNDTHAVLLVQTPKGASNLVTIALP